MSDFFHDPTTDDSGDTFVIHTSDGLTLELCPTCLTVRGRDARALARVPLNLDRIEGVAAGSHVTAHATHAHLLTVRRNAEGLEVSVSTPHLELFRRHLPLPSMRGEPGGASSRPQPGAS
ncbi:MAG: hypothetical protein P8Y13_07540 [Deinococcales bacterium]